VASKNSSRYIDNKFSLNLKIGALFVLMHDYAICEIWRCGAMRGVRLGIQRSLVRDPLFFGFVSNVKKHLSGCFAISA
jgi:hypothetical protein